jgi:olfactory receptor
MYFLFSFISFSDIYYSTAVGPKMLMDLLDNNKLIPFLSCDLTLLTVSIFTDAECMLLAVMAFDWYKTISNPCSRQ